jgi:hypothetical protein
LIYERLGLHFKATYDFIMSGLSEFWGYSSPIHESKERGLTMFFFWREGTDPQPLRDRVDEGVEYLKGLMGSDSIARKDTEGENSLTVELRATLASNLEERYELTIYDDQTNSLLSRSGIYVVERQIYLNYGREAYRLAKQYRDQALRDKLQELKEGPIYSKLVQGILRQLDAIMAGV